jgi:hypothetical protein
MTASRRTAIGSRQQLRPVDSCASGTVGFGDDVGVGTDVAVGFAVGFGDDAGDGVGEVKAPAVGTGTLPPPVESLPVPLPPAVAKLTIWLPLAVFPALSVQRYRTVA